MTIITAQQQQDLYKLAVGLYHAAPGTIYMGALADSVAGGMSPAQLYDALANLPSFRGQNPLYDDTASDAQFVSQFVENLVGDHALQADKDAIAAYLTTLLPATTRGALMKLAIDALDAVDESDATWGDAAARLHNRIEAARYYTETLQGPDTDLAVLQGKIAGVTSDAASLTAVNQANAIAANPDVPSGTTSDPAEEPDPSDAGTQPGAPDTPDAASEPIGGADPEPTSPVDATPDANEEAAAPTDPAANAVPHDDTVTVADHSVMSLNSRADDSAADLTINTYLNYDHLNVDEVTDRLSLAELRAGEQALNGGETPQACNIAQFNFSLGGGSDSVSYHNETARIAAVVGFNVNDDTQFVMIDGSNTGRYDDSIADRVDRLVDVENIVASQGESILDVTNSTMDLAITFSRDITEEDGFDVHRVQLANLSTDAVFGMNYLEHRDNDLDDNDDGADNDPDDAADIFAVWNTIQGSDMRELVGLTDAETDYAHAFYLRGGANEVNYNELTRSITVTIDVVDYDEDDPADTGLIEVGVEFTDGNLMVIGEQDFISSYSAQNLIYDPNGDGVGDSSLRVEASQDAEDSVAFAAGLTKLYILGEAVAGSDQITVLVGEAATDDSIVLTGFEQLLDAASDDVYLMEDLERVVNNLTLADNPADDLDAISVDNDAVDFDGFANDTISLEQLNDEFSFDFDVLDIVRVTDGDLLIVGDTDLARDLNDAVRVGDLGLIDDISLFSAIIFTDASIAGAGDEFVIDIDNGELEDGEANVLFTFDTATAFDFSEVSPDTNLAITVIDTGGVGVTVITDGQDTIAGGVGDDTLIGGGDADVMDGGIAAEIREFNLDGIPDDAGNFVSFDWLSAGNLILAEAAVADTDYTDGNGAVVDGAGSAAIGTALAALLDSNLTQVNADWVSIYGAGSGVITDVSYSTSTDLLTFTFASGFDVTDPINLGFALNGDTGTFAVSAEATSVQGGDGGSDTFVYNVASESTLASMDSIPFFTIDGATGSDDVIDLSALNLPDIDFAIGALVTDFAAAQTAAQTAFSTDAAEVFAVGTLTTSWVFVDVTDNDAFDSGTDMVIALTGVTSANLANMTAVDNFLF